MTPKPQNVRFYPTAAAAQAGRLPGVPAVPARRDSRARRSGTRAPTSSGRAMRLIADGVVDRGGRRRARPPARLQRAAPEPAADRRGRRGSDRAGSRAARPDAPACSSRRPSCHSPQVAFAAGLLEHPPVQRHDPPDLRDAHPASMRAGVARGRDLAPPGVDRPAAAVPHAVRRRRAWSSSSPRAPCPASKSRGHDLPAHAAPGPRRGRRRADPAARPRPRRAPARRPPRPHRGGAAVPSPVRPRCRPAGRRGAARRRPHPRPARRQGSRPAPAGHGRRLRDRDASRARAAGLACRARAPSPDGSSPAHGTPLAVPDGGLTHLFPQADAVADSPLDALGMPAARRAVLPARRGRGRERRGRRSTPAPTVPRRPTALLDIRGVGPWTASTSRCAASAIRTCSWRFRPRCAPCVRAPGLPTVSRRVAEHADRWRPWRSYAVMHLWRSL